MSIQSQKLSEKLRTLTKDIDIPPSKYKEATDRYKHVGKKLSEIIKDRYGLAVFIFPHGSFKLGTVIKPLLDMAESNYDIDLVFNIEKSKYETDPEAIKNIVGDAIQESIYNSMVEDEGRRCWTIVYKPIEGIGFHIDVLPCANGDFEPVIAITNRLSENNYEWKSSDPKGYYDWFNGINEPFLKHSSFSQKSVILNENRDFFQSIEEVPDTLVKTPLRRAVQILKRHRDITFIDTSDEEFKPSSIIITTLAGKLYSGEGDVFTALSSIVNKLSQHKELFTHSGLSNYELNEKRVIMRHSSDGHLGKWEITNPANPEENFADKWEEDNNARPKAFFRWVNILKEELETMLETIDDNELNESIIRKSFYIGKGHSEKKQEQNKPFEINQTPKPWSENDSQN